MRLNRVLLLAASINMAMLATVFTISCSGDDGKAGDSCEARPADDGGSDIFCGGKMQTHIPPGPEGPQGGKGNSGDPGNTSGYCNVSQPDPYNKYEQRVECGIGANAQVFWICNGMTFDGNDDYALATEVCLNDKGHSNDTKIGTVEGGTVLQKDDPRLECQGVHYNPNDNFCVKHPNDPAKDSTALSCGGGSYASVWQFCLVGGSIYGGNEVRSKCYLSASGSSPTAPDEGFTYNNTQFCKVPGSATEPGSDALIIVGSFVGDTTLAAAGKVTDLCGGQTYGQEATAATTASGNIATFTAVTYCVDGKKLRLCNSTEEDYYDAITSFCQNMPVEGASNKAVSKPYCGGIQGIASTYNDGYAQGATRCQGGIVETKCGEGTAESPAAWYNAKTSFCRDKAKRPASSQEREVAPICFKVADGAASATEITDAYGATPAGNAYDGDVYHCNQAKGEVAKMCGAQFYNESQFCYGALAGINKVGDKCRDIAPGTDGTYDPDEAFCSWKYDEAEDKLVEVAVGYCGSSKTKYNFGSWEWTYCTGAAANTFLYCNYGEKESTSVSCQSISCPSTAPVLKVEGTKEDPFCQTTSECLSASSNFISKDQTACYNNSCPVGEFKPVSGSNCVSDCAPAFINLAGDKCVAACEAEEIKSSDGKRCLARCPSGQFISSTGEICVATCPGGSENGKCIATCEGTTPIIDFDGSCVASCSAAPGVEEIGGACRCASNYSFDAGACVQNCLASNFEYGTPGSCTACSGGPIAANANCNGCTSTDGVNCD